MVAKPRTDQLMPAITRLLVDLTQILGDKREYSDEEYLEVARKSPIIRPALQALSLLVIAEFDAYTHEDEKIQDFIRKQFEQMRGSLALSIEELTSFYAFGRAVSQWGIEDRGGEWSLIDIQILDPVNYEFMGRLGAVEKLRVYVGGSESFKEVPYGGDDGRLIHLINGRSLCFRDPDGVPALDAVMASWQAWKIIMGEMVVAGQRQATPLLVGYSDSNSRVPLVDSTGTPLVDGDGNTLMVSAPNAMLDQLAALDNRSVLSTDINNRIEALSATAGSEFFVNALKYLQQMQLLGLMMPESILTATGVGDSNLNAGQRDTLGQLVASLASQIKEALLEQVVRKLIVWNFGDQDSYGEFPSPETDDTNKVEVFNALVQAVSQGFFSPADLDVINKGRELVGLPEMAQEELDAQQEAANPMASGPDLAAASGAFDQTQTETPPPDQQPTEQTAQGPDMTAVAEGFARKILEEDMGNMIIVNGGIHYNGHPSETYSATSEEDAQPPDMTAVAQGFALIPDGDYFATNPDFDPEIAAEWLDIVRAEINRQVDAITDYQVLEDGTVILAAVDGPRQLAIRISADSTQIEQKVLNAKQLQASGVG